MKKSVIFALIFASFLGCGLLRKDASAFFTGVSVGATGGGLVGGIGPTGGGSPDPCTGPLITYTYETSLNYSIQYRLNGGSWITASNGIFNIRKDESFAATSIDFRIDAYLSDYDRAVLDWGSNCPYYSGCNVGLEFSESGQNSLSVNTSQLKNGFFAVYPGLKKVSYTDAAVWVTGYPYCGCPSGCISGYWGFGSKSYSFDVGVFKEAESVFGLETKISAKTGETYGNKEGSARTALNKSGDEYTFSDSVNNYFRNGQSKEKTLSTDSSDGEKFFMGSPLNYQMEINFQDIVYRGLNTKYETYVDETMSYQTNYSLDKTRRGSNQNSSGKIGTMPPAAGEHKERPEYDELSVTYLDQSTVTLSNNKGSGDKYIPLGTHDLVFCDGFSHPTLVLVQMSGPSELERGNTKACIHVFRPYNFDLNVKTSNATSENVQYHGDIEKVSIKAFNKQNENPAQEGKWSYSPDGTTIKVFTMMLYPDLNITDGNGGDGNADVCGFFQNKFGVNSIIPDSCKQLTKSNNGETGVWSTATNPPYTINDNGDIVFPDGVPFGGEGGEIAGLGISAGVKIPDDLDAGTKICFVSAINYIDSNYNPTGKGLGYGNMNGNRWRISNISCRPVAVKPTAQILGGDVFASGDVKASESTFGGISFGSWTDYGLVSNGQIDNLASGAYGSTGRGSSSNPNCTKSPMTISNKPACSIGYSGSLGNAGVSPNTSFTERLMARFDSANKENNANYIKVSGDKRISELLGGNYTLGSGTQVIILDSGNLFIDASLRNGSDIIDNIANIPQRIIIVKNGNINISENVDRIDAWLVAPNGEINTCISADGTTLFRVGENGISANSRSSSGVCSGKLLINGTLVANSLRLNRTYFSTVVGGNGAEYVYNNYAERIQLPFSSIMWSYNNVINHSRTNYNIDYIRELAPRY